MDSKAVGFDPLLPVLGLEQAPPCRGHGVLPYAGGRVDDDGVLHSLGGLGDSGNADRVRACGDVLAVDGEAAARGVDIVGRLAEVEGRRWRERRWRGRRAVLACVPFSISNSN